jgi:hypothetical protein
LARDERIIQFLLLDSGGYAFVIGPDDIQRIVLSEATVARVSGPVGTMRTLLAAGVDHPRGFGVAAHSAGGRSAPTQLSDGTLSLQDVTGLGLEGSPLVVLSACDAARGELLSGGEVASLSEAFIDAGSKDVIATLWPINDAGAREFMSVFYSHLDAGPTSALASAQRELISKHVSAAIWAAFTLTGM